MGTRQAAGFSPIWCRLVLSSTPYLHERRHAFADDYGADAAFHSHVAYSDEERAEPGADDEILAYMILLRLL